MPGPHQVESQRLHDELRSNVLNTIVGNYGRTGFLWENYGDDDARGKGSHPFTGWTALLVLIAGQQYIDL